MKKLALLLCILCLFATGCGKGKGNEVMEKVDFVVEVEEGREPIILQLADPQIIDAGQQRSPQRLSAVEQQFWASDKAEENCYVYLRETIEKTHPDLILIVGDIIYGEFDDSGKAMESFVKFMDSFGIPWAPVFGNHDNESKKGVDWQCEQFVNAENCLFKQRELTGNGNYTVGISQGGELKRVFFMMDSNGCGNISKESMTNGHTVSSIGFGRDQMTWYTELAEEITELSPETKYTFAFHIQPRAFADAFKSYGYENGASLKNGINIDTSPNKKDGDFGYLGQGFAASWDDQNLVWNSFKDLGVDSVLVGHEHANSASVMYEGIRCQFVQKSSTYDQINYVQNGRYITSACKNLKPVVGGTVFELSEDDGSIVNPHIYLCEGIGN
ncbi:MAG: metallophosphoesterase [Tyzzerella sp.]|nr:metallophosphoesterase [Tyzzerella sp.]